MNVFEPQKISVPLLVVLAVLGPLLTLVGAAFVMRERVENLTSKQVEHAKAIDELKERHEVEHVQIEVLKTDVKYIREGVDRIEQKMK